MFVCLGWRPGQTRSQKYAQEKIPNTNFFLQRLQWTMIILPENPTNNT